MQTRVKELLVRRRPKNRCRRDAIGKRVLKVISAELNSDTKKPLTWRLMKVTEPPRKLEGGNSELRRDALREAGSKEDSAESARTRASAKRTRRKAEGEVSNRGRARSGGGGDRPKTRTGIARELCCYGHFVREDDLALRTYLPVRILMGGERGRSIAEEIEAGGTGEWREIGERDRFKSGTEYLVCSKHSTRLCWTFSQVQREQFGGTVDRWNQSVIDAIAVAASNQGFKSDEGFRGDSRRLKLDVEKILEEKEDPNSLRVPVLIRQEFVVADIKVQLIDFLAKNPPITPEQTQQQQRSLDALSGSLSTVQLSSTELRTRIGLINQLNAEKRAGRASKAWPIFRQFAELTQPEASMSERYYMYQDWRDQP